MRLLVEAVSAVLEAKVLSTHPLQMPLQMPADLFQSKSRLNTHHAQEAPQEHKEIDFQQENQFMAAYLAIMQLSSRFFNV